jgi:hypothetical protein
MEHLLHDKSIIGLNKAITWDFSLDQHHPTNPKPQQSPHHPISSATSLGNRYTRIFFDPCHDELIMFNEAVPTEVFVSSKFHNSWIRFPLELRIPSKLADKNQHSKQPDLSIDPLHLTIPITNASVSPYHNYLAVLISDNDVHVYSLRTGKFIQHCQCSVQNVKILSPLWINPATIPTSKKEQLVFVPNQEGGSKENDQPHESNPATVYQHSLKSPFDLHDFNRSMGKHQVKEQNFEDIILDSFASDGNAQLYKQKISYFQKHILPYLQSQLLPPSTPPTPSQLPQILPTSPLIPFSNSIELITSPVPLQHKYQELSQNLTPLQRLQWASLSPNNEYLSPGIRACDNFYSEEDEDDEAYESPAHRRHTTITVGLNNSNGRSQLVSSLKTIPSSRDLHLIQQPPSSMALISPLDQIDTPSTVTPYLRAHSPQASINIPGQRPPSNSGPQLDESQVTAESQHSNPTVTISAPLNKSNPNRMILRPFHEAIQQNPHLGEPSPQIQDNTPNPGPSSPLPHESITEYILLITNIGIESQAVSPTALTRQQTIAFSIDDFWFEPKGNFLLCSTPSKILHLIQIVYNLPINLDSLLSGNKVLPSSNPSINSAPKTPNRNGTAADMALQSPIELIRVTKFEIDESGQVNRNAKPIEDNDDTEVTGDAMADDLNYPPDLELLQQGLPSIQLKTLLNRDTSHTVPLSKSLSLLQHQNDPLVVHQNKLFLPTPPTSAAQITHEPAISSESLFGFNVSVVNNELISPHSNSLILNSKLPTDDHNHLYRDKSTPLRGYRLSLLTVYNRLYISLHDEHSGALLLFTLGNQGFLIQTHTFQTHCRGRCIISVKHDLINIIQVNGDLISYEQYWWNLSIQQQMSPQEQDRIDMCYIASRCCMIDIKTTGPLSMTHQWLLLNSLTKDASIQEITRELQVPLSEQQTYSKNRLLTLLSDYQPQTTYTLTPAEVYATSTGNSLATIPKKYIFYPPCYLLTVENNSTCGSLSIIVPNYYNIMRQATYIQYPSLLGIFSRRSPVICKYYHMLLLRSMIISEGFIEQANLYQNLLHFQTVSKNQMGLESGCPNITIADLSVVQDIVHDVLDATFHCPPHNSTSSPSAALKPPHPPGGGLFDFSASCYCCCLYRHSHEYLKKTPPLPTIASGDSLSQVQQQHPHTLTSFSWLISRSFVNINKAALEPVSKVTYLGDHTYINPYQFSPSSLKTMMNKTNHDGGELGCPNDSEINSVPSSPLDHKVEDNRDIEPTVPTQSPNWGKSLPLSYFPLKHPLFHIITADGSVLLTQSDILHYIYLPLYYHYMTCPHMNLCSSCQVVKDPLKVAPRAPSPTTPHHFDTLAGICLECLVKQQIRSIHLHFLTNLLVEHIRSACRFNQTIQQQYYIFLIILLIKQQQFQLLHQSLLYGVIDGSLDVIIKLLVFFLDLYRQHQHLEAFSGDTSCINLDNNDDNQFVVNQHTSPFPSADLLALLGEIEQVQTQSHEYIRQNHINIPPTRINSSPSPDILNIKQNYANQQKVLLELLHSSNLLSIHPFCNLMNVQAIIYEINYITHPKPHYPYIYTQYLQYVLPILISHTTQTQTDSLVTNQNDQDNHNNPRSSTLPPTSALSSFTHVNNNDHRTSQYHYHNHVGFADAINLKKVYCDPGLYPSTPCRLSPRELTDILIIEERNNPIHQSTHYQSATKRNHRHSNSNHVNDMGVPDPTQITTTIPDHDHHNSSTTNSTVSSVLVAQSPQYPSMNSLLFPFAQDIWFSSYASQLRSLLDKKTALMNSYQNNEMIHDELSLFLSSTQDQYLSALQYRHYHCLHFYNTTYIPMNHLYRFISQSQISSPPSILMYKYPNLKPQIGPSEKLITLSFPFSSFLSIIDRVISSSNHITLLSPLPPLTEADGLSSPFKNSHSLLQYPRKVHPIQSKLHRSSPLSQYIFDIFFRRNYGLQILQHLTHQYQATSALRLLSNKNRLLQTNVKHDMFASVQLMGSDVHIFATQKYIEGTTQISSSNNHHKQH